METDLSGVDVVVESRRGWRRGRLRPMVVAGLVGGLVAGLVGLPAQATPAVVPGYAAARMEPLDGDGGPVAGRAWPYTPQEREAVAAPVWPAAGVAQVSLPASTQAVEAVGVRAGGLPVTVGRAGGSAGAALSTVEVEVVDRAMAPAGWRDGVLLRVGAVGDAASSAAVQLSVDYSGFQHAFGGDWASRLRLWRLPECALKTPAAEGCTARPLPSSNDGAAGVVSARVPVDVFDPDRAGRDRSADGAVGTLVAVAAGPSGEAGDFAATSLSPSATWSAGGNNGAFSWSYPMRVPPAAAGLAPAVALSYSSSAVDGRSAATNNQPSWVGEGFEYWPGFIERRYGSCAEDMAGGANNTVVTGDLCWRSDNAVLSLNGAGSELVFEQGKGWHARSENGSRIEKLSGAANGDNDGEYWKVTTADGTQYFFGRHALPGQGSVTNSAWTVPVAGNHTGEPCRAGSFAGSFCAQAWRWNLDYVVDVRGNTISYWYTPETNLYARNRSDVVSYVRGGTLARIDYGTWDRGGSDRSVTATAQVLFASADRCVTSTCGTHDAANWPDTPWDQECGSGTCAGRYAPTFWSTRRLSSVTTRVWDTSLPTPGWQDVESWTLTHSFPPVGDGSVHAGLWLERIEQAGLVRERDANGAPVGDPVRLPPVTFMPVSLPNRVLTQNTTTFNWQRVGQIITETGAKIDVAYSRPECTSSNLPAAAESNTKRCYPVLVPDPNDPQGQRLVPQWWHMYVVESVSESDVQLAGTPGAPSVSTYYRYVGAPAWHYADDDGLSPANRRTWNQFRGYATVETRVGDMPGQQSLTVTTYLRGMHGDRAAPAGGTRTVTVAASVGSETVYDEDQFAGMVREQVVYNGVTTKPVSKTVNVPWLSAATASRTINGNVVTARFTNTKIVYEATALGVDGARGWRTTRAESWYSDAYGTVERQQDDGDVAVAGDEKCIAYDYNRNTGVNLLGTVRRANATALPCGTDPTSTDHVISDVRYSYDGAADADKAPTFGSVTRTEQLKDWSPAGGGVTVWQTVSQASFDAFGRATSVTDIKGNVTTTGYTPAAGGPVTKITTTRVVAPANWVSYTEVNPYWGSTTKTTDPNNRVAEAVYDPLGRVAKVWQVGWARAGHENGPSAEYSYRFAPNRDAYPYVTTRTLHAGGGYRTTVQILDALLRPRQTQTAGVGGEVVVTDTLYDRNGRAAVGYDAHLEPGTPSGTLWGEPEWSVPAVVKTVYDNADRPVAQILYAGDSTATPPTVVEKWRTTTSYEGDLTKTTPPQGGTPTTVVTDAHDRTVELRQDTTLAGVGGAFQSTGYLYNGKDQLVKVTDPAGNEWTYTFDIKGRQIRTSDPDRGVTSFDYNDFNELEKTTDARGEVLWRVYDALGRQRELRDDSATGPLRARWVYDRLYTGATVKGQLTETYRYEPAGSSNAYRWQVGGFTTRYQPTNVNYVIPTSEGTGVGGSWNYGYGYTDSDGSPTSIRYPAAGGLPAETVTTGYDPTTGLPTTLDTSATGVGTYIASQSYTPFGEPEISTRQTAGGLYVQETTYYDEATRRINRVTIKPETGGVVSDRNYTYDAAGNITSITDQPEVGQTDLQCFRYDTLRRLTSAWTPKTTTGCTPNPTTATLDGPAPYWLDWTIDPIGNRTGEVRHAAGGDTTRSYTVPTGGRGVTRPHAVTSITTGTGTQPTITTNYGYDNTGNTTCRPTGTAANTCPTGTGSQTLTWDAEGRLATVATGSGTQQTNIYDADGTRWIRRDTTGTTLYLPGQETRRTSSGATNATRYYGFNGQTIATRTPTGGLTWTHTDHQGTQHTTIDTATQTATTRRQTPYGQPRGTTPTWTNPKGFVNGDTDPTNLTHIGAREYDPGTGRFISIDPIMELTDPQQIHGYAYSNNNPTTYSDPTGKLYCDDSDCSQKARPQANGGYSIIGTPKNNSGGSNTGWKTAERRLDDAYRKVTMGQDPRPGGPKGGGITAASGEGDGVTSRLVANETGDDKNILQPTMMQCVRLRVGILVGFVGADICGGHHQDVGDYVMVKTYQDWGLSGTAKDGSDGSFWKKVGNRVKAVGWFAGIGPDYAGYDDPRNLTGAGETFEVAGAGILGGGGQRTVYENGHSSVGSFAGVGDYVEWGHDIDTKTCIFQFSSPSSGLSC